MDDDDLFDDEKPEEAGAAADEDAEFQNGMVAVYARPRTSMERELDVPCSMRIDDDATNSICVIDPADGQERSWVVDALFKPVTEADWKDVSILDASSGALPPWWRDRPCSRGARSWQ